MKCSGIDHTLKIAKLAELAGIGLMWGCNDESIVLLVVSMDF